MDNDNICLYYPLKKFKSEIIDNHYFFYLKKVNFKLYKLLIYD